MGQSISTTQFIVYGKQHFTKTGYLKHISQYYKAGTYQTAANVRIGDDGSDNVDMTGQVVCITGANSGLGKQVATYVACKNAKLYMLCRSKERAEQAKQDIIKDAQLTDNTNQIEIIQVDVSELDQVRNAVKLIQDKEKHIHCLVCNAGVLLNEQANTKYNNIEQTFASHLLGGTYLLTQLLLPTLQSTPNSRVVVVTSGGMYNTPIPSWDILTSYTVPLDDNNNDERMKKQKNYKYNGTMSYAHAKRGQVVLVEEWSKQYENVKFVTVHPGWTDTPAVDEWLGDKKSWLQPLREPWQGAEGVAWLTHVPIEQIESGELYLDRKVQKKHIAGPFMTEGNYTKNKPNEIQEFLNNLKKASEL